MVHKKLRKMFVEGLNSNLHAEELMGDSHEVGRENHDDVQRANEDDR